MPSAGGTGEFFREIYRKAEDAFYTALDWLDAHKVPAYRVHDWMEDRGIPPFPAFLTVILLIVSAGILLAVNSAPTYNVTVYVQDVDGNPVPDAKVTLTLESGGKISSSTDSSGNAYFLNLPEKPVSISVSADGYRDVKKPMTGTSATITLEYASSTEMMEVCVKPTDAETGMTVEGVKVLASYVKSGNPATKTLTYDSLYGAYCAEFPKDTEVTITVAGGGYQTVTKTVSSEYPKNSPLRITIYKTGTSGGLQGETYSVSVQVLYNGTPISASVSIRRENESKYLSTEITDANGFAVLTVPEAGKYFLAVIARGEYSGWTATKVITVPDDTNVVIDVYKEGADTNGVIGDYNDLTRITSQPGEEEKKANEFNVTICPYDERTGRSIPNASVRLGDKEGNTGESGCVKFTNVRPMDTPYPLFIDAGDEYLPYNGTLAVGGSATFRIKISVKDAPPSITFNYYELGGVEILGPPAGKHIILHFNASLPYHIKSAKAVFDNGGVPGFSLPEGDHYEVDLTDKRGSTFDLTVPVDVEDSDSAFLQYQIEVEMEDGSIQRKSGTLNPEIVKTVLSCTDGRTALRFVVSRNPIIVGKPTTLTVYAGSCDANTTISSVEASVNGKKVNLSNAGGGEKYTTFVGSFTIPAEEKEHRAKVDVRAYDDAGNLINRTFKYFDVAESVGSFSVQITPSTKEGNVYAFFRNYESKVKICAASKVADRMEVSINYQKGNKAETKSGSVDLSGGRRRCYSASITPTGGTVQITAAFYDGAEAIANITKEYPVVDHMNHAKICVRDADSKEPVTANVSLYGKNYNYSGETNDDGCIDLNVGDDIYTIHITASDYLPREIEGIDIHSGEFRRTYYIYRPVDDPVVRPVEITGPSGERVAAITPGRTYTVVVEAVLPPRVVSGKMVFSLPTGFTESEPITDGKEQTVSPADSNSVKRFKVKIKLPDSAPYEDISLEYDLNVKVKTNEGDYEYKGVSGSIGISIVPKDLVCGENEGYALAIVPMYKGKPVNNIIPPEVQKEDRTIRVYYGKCNDADLKSIFLYKRSERIGEPQSAYPLDRFTAAYVEFVLPVSRSDIGKTITLSASASDGKKIVGTAKMRSFQIGQDICIDVSTDPVVPTEDKDLTIMATPYNCTTGEKITDVKDLHVYIKSGTAETDDGTVQNPPIELTWNGDAFTYSARFSKGTILLECTSGTHLCSLRPDVIFVYPSGGKGLSIDGPNTVYVQENEPNTYEFTITGPDGTTLVDDDGKSMIRVQCDPGISAEIKNPPSYVNKNGTIMEIAFYATKDGECIIIAGGYYTGYGNRRNYVTATKKVEITTKTAILPTVTIEKEFPDELYPHSIYYITADVKVDDISTDSWELVSFAQNIVCEDGEKPTVSVVREEKDKDGYTLHKILEIQTKGLAKNCKLHVQATVRVGAIESDGYDEKVFTVIDAEAVPVNVSAPAMIDLASKEEDTFKIVLSKKSNVDHKIPVTLQFQITGDGVDVTVDGTHITNNNLTKTYVLDDSSKEITVKVTRKRNPKDFQNTPTLKITVYGGGKAIQKEVKIIPSYRFCIGDDSYIASDGTYVQNSCDFDIGPFYLQPVEYRDAFKTVGMSIPKGEVGFAENVEDPRALLALTDVDAVRFAITQDPNVIHGFVSIKLNKGPQLVGTDGKPVPILPINDKPFEFGSCAAAFCGRKELEDYINSKIAELIANGGSFSFYAKDVGSVEIKPAVDVIPAPCSAITYDSKKGTIENKEDCSKDDGIATLYYDKDKFSCGKWVAHVETDDGITYVVFTKAEIDGKDMAKYCNDDSFYYAPIHINLGRYNEEGAAQGEEGAFLGTIQPEEEGSSPVMADDLKKIDAAIGSPIPFRVAGPSQNTAKNWRDSKNDVIVYKGDCDVSGNKVDAIAELEGSSTKLVIRMCNAYVEKNPDSWQKMAGRIIRAIFSYNQLSDSRIDTKVYDDGGKKRIFVLAVSEGTIPNEREIRFAPDANVVVRFDIPRGRGLFDPGNYDLEITLSGIGKDCISNVKAFGEDASNCIGTVCNDVRLTPVSDPKISFHVNGAKECMKDFTMIVTLTPIVNNGNKEEQPMTFVIVAHPLAVSFDKLVAALTCPNFELKTLGEDVAWSVLRAAVGNGSTDICSVDKNPFNGSDGYTWAVAPNQTALTYVAKKNGTPTDNDYDFKIIFPADNDGKSEPTVWVKDADKERAKQVIEQIVKSEGYQTYLLAIKFDGQTYANENAKLQAIKKAISPGFGLGALTSPIHTTYATTCAVTTGLCEVWGAGLTWGAALANIAAEVPMCFVSSYLAGFTYSRALSASESQLASGSATALLMFPLGGGLEVGYTYAERYAEKLALNKGAIPWFIRRFGPTSVDVWNIAKKFNGGHTSYEDTVKNIINVISKSKSKSLALDWSNVKFADVLGITDQKEMEQVVSALSQFLGKDKAEDITNLLKQPAAKVAPQLSDRKSLASQIVSTIENFGQPGSTDELASTLGKLKVTVAEDETYTKRLIDRAKPPSVKRAFFCGALGNAVASAVAYGTLASTLSYDALVVDIETTGPVVKIAPNTTTGARDVLATVLSGRVWNIKHGYVITVEG